MPLTFLSTFAYIFFPAASGRRWLTASPWQAVLAAGVHLLILPVWMTLLITSVFVLDGSRFSASVIPGFRIAMSRFAQIFPSTPHSVYTDFLQLPLLDRISALLMPLILLMLLYVMLFFFLLPFAARPGANKPCITHALRTSLLATGILHLAFLLLIVVFLFAASMPHVFTGELVIRLLLLVLLPLFIWILAALIRIVRLDYRAPADLPQPHDPWCERCGYNLSNIDPAHRCPECGKPIPESTGPATRPPTAWEIAPSPRRISTILRQIKQLILRPIDLFSSMPTLTGQRTAQRWLLLSAAGVGFLAFLILPVIHFGFLSFDLSFGDILLRSLAVGIVWAMLALMMVGIETAGIATFSRMRHHPGGGVPLATAAKVTAYSSTLMLPWVLLGFAQILASLYWYDSDYGPRHHTMRNDQIFVALSLAIAHIGGLLWYELTVYRGIKGVQYANK